MRASALSNCPEGGGIRRPGCSHHSNGRVVELQAGKRKHHQCPHECTERRACAGARVLSHKFPWFQRPPLREEAQFQLDHPFSHPGGGDIRERDTTPGPVTGHCRVRHGLPLRWQNRPDQPTIQRSPPSWYRRANAAMPQPDESAVSGCELDSLGNLIREQEVS